MLQTRTVKRSQIYHEKANQGISNQKRHSEPTRKYENEAVQIKMRHYRVNQGNLNHNKGKETEFIIKNKNKALQPKTGKTNHNFHEKSEQDITSQNMAKQTNLIMKHPNKAFQLKKSYYKPKTGDDSWQPHKHYVALSNQSK